LGAAEQLSELVVGKFTWAGVPVFVEDWKKTCWKGKPTPDMLLHYGARMPDPLHQNMANGISLYSALGDLVKDVGDRQFVSQLARNLRPLCKRLACECAAWMKDKKKWAKEAKFKMPGGLGWVSA